MKNKILAISFLFVMVGCASTSNEESKAIKDDITDYEQEVISIDENGYIIDDMSVITIDNESYQSEMDNILTEDGYEMRIKDANSSDQESVKNSNIVYFSFDSYEITPKMKEVIDTQINFLKKYSKIKVILEGHTDERGSNSYNVILGEKRANEVKKILINAGIPASQVEVISYGEMKPISYGVSNSDHSKNRRAVFVYK